MIIRKFEIGAWRLELTADDDGFSLYFWSDGDMGFLDAVLPIERFESLKEANDAFLEKMKVLL